LLGRVSSIQCGDGGGLRQVRPAAPARAWAQMIVRILQTSELATSLYLRLAGYWGSFSFGRATCRA
jgi:hypothetical protein